jgi:flagellar motor switch protein FliN/FliY
MNEPKAVTAGLQPGGIADLATGRSIELLYNVEMAVTVELGRTRMSMRDLLNLRPGKIVQLDHAAQAPVDVLVNSTLLARGEVVVVDEELGVRVTEIVGSSGQQPAV